MRACEVNQPIHRLTFNTRRPKGRGTSGGVVGLSLLFIFVFNSPHDTIESWFPEESIFDKSSRMFLEMDLLFCNAIWYCNLYCKYRP